MYCADRALRPSTESKPDRMHSFRPVPNTIACCKGVQTWKEPLIICHLASPRTSYSSSMVPHS